MAVHGRLAGVNRADELRHGEAARILVDEISKRTFRRRRQLRLVLEMDGDLAFRGCLSLVDRREDGYDDELAGSGILDRIGLPRRDEHPGLGPQLVKIPADLEVSRSRRDVEDLLPAVERMLRRAPRRVTDDPLLEPLGAV